MGQGQVRVSSIVLSGLFVEWKRTLGASELLGLARTANTTVETGERDDLLVLLYISEVSIGLFQL